MQRKMLTVAFVVMALQSAARAQSDAIEFSPPRRGSVMQTSGGTSRGELVRVTSDKVVIRRGGQDFDIEMSVVRRIRSADGDFDHTPSKETFAVLFDRAARIPGVLVKEGVGPTTPVVPQPAVQATLPTQPEPADDPPMATLPEGAVSDPPAVSEDSQIKPAPGSTLIKICQNCMKEVPVSIKDGDRCPHCNIIIWNHDHQATLAQANANAGNQENGGGPGGFPAAREGFPEPNANGAAESNSQTQIVNGAGNSLADIPTWMKVGFFVGLLALGWFLLQRR